MSRLVTFVRAAILIVGRKIFRVVGTPTEESWPGVSRLPHYRPHKLSFYRAHRLATAWPRLGTEPGLEHLAAALLQTR